MSATSPLDFNKIPKDKRNDFRKSYLDGDWEKVKAVLKEEEAFLSHCPDCSINKVVQEWTDALFDYMSWEDWLNGGSWK